MADGTYDVAVIGAGPGGYVAAIRAAQLGLKTAVVERENLGGVCLNWGCIPTKSLLRSAEVLELAQHAADYGVEASGVKGSLEAMVKRSRAVAGQLNQGVAHLLKKNRVDVRMGIGRLAGGGRVEVEEDGGGKAVLSAKDVVLATGARARDVPGIEADGKLVWTYRHALQPDRLPKRLLVIGSGAIGIEFAHFFRALGSKVTVVEILDRILPAEDEEISAFAEKSFVAAGMDIRKGTKVTDLTRARGALQATVEKDGKSEKLAFDRAIVAVGITGNTEDLGLDKVGVEVDRGHVRTDGHGRAAEGVWAIGDLAGPPWLAHKASHEGVMVAEMIVGGPAHALRGEDVPGCTYCAPQIASVGLTEARARELGHKVRVGRFPLIGNGKAIALGDTEGFIKTVFDEGTGALLGAHMVGPEVTELIQGFAVARALETTEEDLMRTVFPHPTLSEAMHESVLAAYGRAVHI